VIWYATNSGTEEVLGVCAVDLRFLGFGFDSSNQNLAEYIGAVVAVLEQVVLGYSGRSLALRGDSVTALTWAVTERPRGKHVTNASIVWTSLYVATNIDVREYTHIPGDDNDKRDRLSRKALTPAMSVSEEAREMGIEGGAVVEVNEGEGVMRILRLCDPRRSLEGKRGKAASAATAAIRLRFSQEMLDTAFLDSATARSACVLNPEELRLRRSSATASTVKLPVCEEVVENRTWTDPDMKLNMLYCGVMFGFELAARLGEYTEAETGSTDYCVRTDDATFSGEGPDGFFSVSGSALTSLTPAEAVEGFKNVADCNIRGVTTKGKVTVKSKFIGRRSPEESLFLDDLIRFVVHAKARGPRSCSVSARPTATGLCSRAGA
jgi:hypothetical protein